MSFYNYRKKRKRRFYRSLPPGGHCRHHSHRRRRKSSGNRAARIGLAVSGILIVCIVSVLIGFNVLRENGKKALADYAGAEQMEIQGKQAEAGLVSRNGKKYRYKEEIITLLCMGIDTERQNWNVESKRGENGQADAIFLLVLDQKSHTMNLISISRDTMTEIQTFDRQGNKVGESVNHLALAFSYGTTKEEGAELTKEAVSALFYHLPIHGYVAIDWDALGKINDAIGGVTVTLPEDVVLAGKQYQAGEMLHLTGDQAKSFVRYRADTLDGNNERMQRQKLYASAFITEAKKAVSRNPLLTADLYQALTSDMVTSLGVEEAVYLASLLPKISFQMDHIQSLEGTTKKGAVYAEFYVDEEKLTDLILDTFYEEVG